LELEEPTVLTDDDLDLFGGRMPSTQNRRGSIRGSWRGPPP
jgi:hypothetical protein